MPSIFPTHGLDRPATALLSYAWEDAVEVKFLQLQLNVRGVRTWRDVTSLPLGGATEEEIVEAIENTADAIVIYVTPHSLKSRFVWEIEIKTAFERQGHDPHFKIVSILKDVTFKQLQQQCAIFGYRSLKDFNAVSLVDAHETGASFKEQLRSVANRVLQTTLESRLRRIEADSSYEPWIRFFTFVNKPPASCLDLDLNWSDLFNDGTRLASTDEWQEILFPALQDVKNALGEKAANHNVHILSQAILPACFALGYVFRASSSFTLLPVNKDVTWSTRGTLDTAGAPFDRIPYPESGNAQVAVVQIDITDETSRATMQYLNTTGLSYGHHILYKLPGDTDHIRGVRNASHALEIAEYIGKEFRKLQSKGVTHIHLFAAIPAALAVMLGHQFNALCPISIYYYVAGREYELACTLAQNWEERARWM
jgi:hypothetical protein